jgi:hypothetical protein
VLLVLMVLLAWNGTARTASGADCASFFMYPGGQAADVVKTGCSQSLFKHFLTKFSIRLLAAI